MPLQNLRLGDYFSLEIICHLICRHSPDISQYLLAINLKSLVQLNIDPVNPFHLKRIPAW